MLNDSPQVQEIKKRFLASFSDKRDVINAHIEAIENSKGLSDDKLLKAELDLSYAELHKYAGSFGMYGYDEISKACRCVMKLIEADEVLEMLTLMKILSTLLEKYIED